MAYTTLSPSGGSSISQSGGSLDDPRLQALLDQIIDSMPTVTPPQRGAQEFIDQGIASPLLQAILLPILQNLIPGERQARTSLTDRFRAAGGADKSSAYGAGMVNLEGELAAKRAGAVSTATSQMLGPILQALLGEQAQDLQAQELEFKPASILAQILSALRPSTATANVSSGSSDPWGTSSRGGGGGGSGGGGRSAGGGGGIDPVTGRQYGFERGMVMPPGMSSRPTQYGEPYPEWSKRVFGYDPLAAVNPVAGMQIGGGVFKPTTLTYPGQNDPYLEALNWYNQTQPAPQVSSGGWEDFASVHEWGWED